MDLRLLHGVVYGCSWFAQFGYKFSHGTYGIQEHTYTLALEKIQSLPVSDITDSFDGSTEDRPIGVRTKVQYYQQLSMHEEVGEVGNCKDLFSFLVRKIHNAEEYKRRFKTIDDIEVPANIHQKHCSKEKICQAVEYFGVILRAKMGSDTKATMFQNAMRAEATQNGPIKAASVLDHVLKRLHNVVVDGHVFIRSEKLGRRMNEGKYKYKLVRVEESREIYNDLQFIYDRVLMGFPNSENDKEKSSVRMCAEAILNCNNFVKGFDIPHEDYGGKLMIKCQVQWPCNYWKNDGHLKEKSELGDIVVVVPTDAKITHLKQAAENALRETYLMTKGFKLWCLAGELGDDDTVYRVGKNPVILIGDGFDLDVDLWFQGGSKSKELVCKCKEADGEKTVECNMCNRSWHNLCLGVKDDDPFHICEDCMMSDKRLKNKSEEFSELPLEFFEEPD